jgi:hypothetical protein
MTPDGIFAFERDFAGALHCIPMVVRLKLDLCGVKLSLRHWNRFDLPDRRQLIRRPCRTASEIAAYRANLVLLIAIRAGEAARELAIEPRPEWEDCARVPVSILDRARRLGLPAPSLRAWAGLTPLQRFALIKLTRGGHDNDNFEPALREFGVLVAL